MYIYGCGVDPSLDRYPRVTPEQTRRDLFLHLTLFFA